MGLEVGIDAARAEPWRIRPADWLDGPDRENNGLATHEEPVGAGIPLGGVDDQAVALAQLWLHRFAAHAMRY